VEDSQRAESHRNLGNVLFESRQLDEAASSYRRALALEPRHAPTHASLGAALRMQGRSAEAQESCRAALTIDANCVAALSQLGELRADRGRFSEAEELFQRAIAVDPGFAFAFYSKWQVRQKIHATSVGRWRNYEKYVAPLRHLVNLVSANDQTSSG
jgi:tetratricopeptide (TPR) repeat protein